MGVNDLIPNKSLWLIGCFIAYLSMIVIFAIIYYSMYLRNVTHFWFAKDIATAKVSEIRSSIEKEIDTQTKKRKILSRLMKFLSTEEVVIKTYDPISLPDGYRVQFGAEVIGEAIDMFFTTPNLTLFDTNGQSLGTWYEDSDQSDFSATGYKRLTARYATTVEYRLKGLHRRLDELLDPSSPKWSFGDFAYFSTMTQTTVGYGDILPNSSTIRKIVMAQILIGYAIVIVVINLFVFL